jgi:hypothetical protein
LFLQDTAFSVIVTALFLRPIFKVLREGGDAVQHSAGYKSLLKTKWMALLGASLAVVSLTALYINMGMFFILGSTGTLFWAKPYLNIMVFGINLGSVLNDISMLLVCGVLKKVDCSSLVILISTFGPSRNTVVKVEPAPMVVFIPNSQASSTYTPGEVGAS